MMPTSLFVECLNFVTKLRHLGFGHPAAIEFGREDGVRLLAELHQTNTMAYRVGDPDYGVPHQAPDGSVWMEIDFAGIKFRWPALEYIALGGKKGWG